ncbi:MAG: FMN-binding negative transcriptional regulator [Solirubrobacteraceae bacterium]
MPAHFTPPTAAAPWKMIDRYGFGILVTAGVGDAPIASSLPFLARRQDRLVIGHIARANEQFEHLRANPGGEALVIFQGPAAFVSAGYYHDRMAIPTWDHITVHVTGPVQMIEDDEGTLEVLRQTVAHFESQAGSDWRLDVARADLPEMVSQVAAFTVTARRVQSIFKLSQNLDQPRRRLVAAGLRNDGHHAVASAVEAVVVEQESS